MRLVTDTIEFAARHTPRFNPISISGYHIREAGSTAVQELAFTLRDGFEYVDWALERGLGVDGFAPRLSFFFNAQTAGCSLTWQQPINNVVRTTVQALAAVMGGTQSLHTNSLDEAYALPSENAVTLALRTQQILAHETGVADVADPLGGSYYVEALTSQIAEAAQRYIKQIDDMGGMLPAIEHGFPQSEIAKASYCYQKEVDAGQRVIVGVNEFQQPGEDPIDLLAIDDSSQRLQVEKLAALRRRRSQTGVEQSLDALKRAAESDQNMMPALLAAVKSYATTGEIVGTLKQVFGVYAERSEW